MLVFVDLDGVLSDFLSAAINHHKLDLDPATVSHYAFWQSFGLSDADFWNPLNFSFWRNLQPTKECFQIIDLVTELLGGNSDVFLCSSPCWTEGCSSGKSAWVEDNLPDEYARRLILTGRKEIFAGPDRILIDDMDKNCKKFTELGGHACLVPRPWNENRHLTHDVVGTVKCRLERILGR